MNAYAKLAEDLRDINYSPAPRYSPVQLVALLRLQHMLPDSPALPFLVECWTADPRISCAAQLAHGVPNSTFVSRFFRAGLPGPKQYLAAARLVRVRECLDDPSCTIKRVALAMEYSSTPALDRHVKLVTGLTPHAWRKATTTEQLFDAWFDALVVPHINDLSTFDPYGAARARKVTDFAKEKSRAA